MSGQNKWLNTKLTYDIIMNVAKNWTPYALEECKTSANNIMNEARKNAPKLSGAMARGIVVVQKGDGFQVVAKVYYTEFQEGGTRYIEGKYFIQNAIKKEMPNFQKAPVRIFKKLKL